MKDKLEIVIFVAPNNFHPLKWSNQSTYFYSIQLDHIHKSQQNISIFASHYLGSPITCNHLPPVSVVRQAGFESMIGKLPFLYLDLRRN